MIPMDPDMGQPFTAGCQTALDTCCCDVYINIQKKVINTWMEAVQCEILQSGKSNEKTTNEYK
jgi:hypothetical protein